MDGSWSTILQTIHDEFFDLPDLVTWTRALTRLVTAAALAGFLGLEREIVGKAAGLVGDPRRADRRIV